MHETSKSKQNIENDHADLRRQRWWRLAEAIYIFFPFDHTARRRPKIRRPAQYIYPHSTLSLISLQRYTIKTRKRYPASGRV